MYSFARSLLAHFSLKILLVFLVHSSAFAVQTCESGSGADRKTSSSPMGAVLLTIAAHNSSGTSPCGDKEPRLESSVSLTSTSTNSFNYSGAAYQCNPTTKAWSALPGGASYSATCSGQPTACQGLEGQRLGGLSVDVPRSGIGGTSACFGDCKVTGAFSVCGCKGDKCQCQTGGSGAQFTGGGCDDPAPSPSQPSPTLPQAVTQTGSRPMCDATINGITIKLPCAETTLSVPKSITKQETTTQSPTTPVNVTRTTTTTTTCKDGKCTSVTGETTVSPVPGTTSFNDPCWFQNGPNFPTIWICGGNPTTPPTGTTTAPGVTSSTSPLTTTTQPQDDFCRDNPKHPICKDDGDTSFGGSCEGGFTCNGDAAQCAQAKGVYEVKCSLKPLETEAQNPIVLGGIQSMTGQNPADHPLKNKTNLSVGTFDQTNPFSTSCPPDKQIGHLLIPFSILCEPMSYFGYIAVAITLIVAARIVVTGA
jgi:hypothetical protein